MKHYLFIPFLLLCIACGEGFVSNLTIPPYQEFALGEFEEGSFEVELLNQSDQVIGVQTRNKAGKTTSSFGLSGKGKSKITVAAGETAVLVNPHAEKVKLRASLKKGVEGMNYSLLNKKSIMENAPSVSMADLSPFISTDWKGKLTYADYQSGEKVSIPC